MTKLALKSLTGAAILLLQSGHVASAGPDGACEGYGAEETVASESAAPSTPVPTAAADYTKIAQIAPVAVNSATAKTDVANAAPSGGSVGSDY